MPPAARFILGEFHRTLDERCRLSIPSELVDPLISAGEECVLAKERPGALSLWNAAEWRGNLDSDVGAIKALMKAGRLQDRLEVVQTFGRLLSARHTQVQLAGRGRLLVPEGFRDFLGVEAGGEVLIVGAALCVEIWRPDAWLNYLEEKIPDFRQVLNDLLETTK